jgi:membrane associated rhomboid family serine protease
MLKLMIAFFVVFLIAFACLFLSHTDIQFFGSVVGMCAGGAGFLISALEHDKRNLLAANDLYDRSAE